MERQSLKELKEENAEAEVVEEEVVEEIVETAEAETDEVAVEEAEPEGEEPKEEAELESWMQAEEAESSETDQKGEFVPNHAVAKVRRKLKAKLSDVKDENEELKARIEQLEQGGTQAPQTNQLPPRPKREDFDYDDEAYDTAVDDWNDKKMDLKLSSHSQTSQQKAAQDQAERSLQDAVTGHYDAAAKLVSEGKVTEDAYLSADRAVRQTLDRAFGGNGDMIADRLIQTLKSSGEGSEKVMYQVGVNPSKLAKLEALMRDNPSGLSASAYLGTLQAQITTPQKRRSTAPAPAAKADGEGNSGGPEGVLHKQYKKAGDDVQARIKIKRAAKAKGVDTSQW